MTFPTITETKFPRFLVDGLEKQGLGKWGFAVDSYEMAQLMIDHVNRKREAQGIMGEGERRLFDMADRQRLQAGSA